ncbi:MAG: AF1514 family protein [Gammaproteobacteria bacterium]|jgi:hypothetical protein|nr:AF1514 family protein [Gammaproteobacteria bacterium]MBT4606886.1 AF1514 family protein [Thiotrichales bacterium]MBT3471921.1 AF1514 family protein [Gammaproteobacteria bacterium]MBT3966262.1 AF1514 family protein [Gammaproteobacteria bacterium]MBT4080897.1 AF1514 family protein [Gammaproteobacteria bacterium]
MLSEIKIITKTREVLRVTAEKIRDPQAVVEIFRDVSLKSWMEIQQTGEMLNTLRKLSLGQQTSEQERQEAIEQAKDVARTVPAFGIFMLPGGALLLPLVAKMVPWRLLPSAFHGEIEEMKTENCPATPRAPLQEPPTIEMHPVEPLANFDAAKAIADAEAERRLDMVMLLSWYDRDRDFESPQHASECHEDSAIPGYVDFGINHGAELKIDMENGRFVFYYLSA